MLTVKGLAMRSNKSGSQGMYMNKAYEYEYEFE